MNQAPTVTTHPVELPGCPKCHKPPLRAQSVHGGSDWFRIFCGCSWLGVGAPSEDEVIEKWRKLCARWRS